MVRRLVIDILRRTQSVYLWMFPIVLLVWLVESAEDAFPTMGLTMSLMLAYAMGPITAISAGGLREVRILPVTNRELWLATCTTSTLVGPLFLLIVQSLAFGAVYAFQGSAALAPETVLLAALYAFVYCGTLLPVGPLLGYASGNIGSRRPRWLWIALTAAGFLIFTGGFGLPYLFASSLPLRFDEFTTTATGALAVCLAITGATWAWTPKRGGTVRPDQAAKQNGAPSAPGQAAMFADSFTGLARIAWSHAVTTIVVSIVTIAAIVAYWAIFESRNSVREFLQRSSLLPFDTAFQPGSDAPGEWMVLLAFFMIAGNGVWNPLAKQLKVLPLTVREINGLFLATPLVTWTLVWIVLVVMHRTVVGALPDSIRPDLLVFAGGTSAVGHMLALRFRRGGTFQWFFMPLGIATSILIDAVGSAPGAWESFALAGAGFGAFGLAAFVNHRTLTRSTSSARAYQRHQLALGLNGQSGQQ